MFFDTEPEETQPTPPPSTDPELDKAMKEVDGDPQKAIDGLLGEEKKAA
jgi:hypothetical protein